MKLSLIDTVLMSLMVVLLMIGGHQTYVISKAEGISNGFFKSYWIFMLMLMVMIIYNARRNKERKQEEEARKNKGKSAKPGSSRKKGQKLK